MAYILIIIYMIIGFFFVKPQSIHDFHWTWVDFSSGFFMYAMPIWIWFLLWIFWLPILILNKVLY